MNIPNLLTIARVVMVMIFVILAANAGKVFFDAEGMPQSVYYVRLTAYILAILAGLTDLVDGYLARRWNQITDFGALMDPLADKVFITATMLMAVEYRLMPAWIVVLVISREFMVTGLRTMAAKRNVVISADRWGKLKTALQMTMLAIAGGSWVGWFDLRHTKFAGVGLWTLWIIFLCGIVAVTVFSGLAYFVRYRHVFMTPAAEKSE
ncbi:MAG: CDP-diacylglycerol--glycerol-3-phosphate 3-phosphatidyltransferase [Victivallaceae bacterium]